MPLPKVNPQESKEKFIERCLSSEVIQRDFKNNAQKYAVCLNIYKQHKKKKSDGSEEIEVPSIIVVD